METRQPKFMFVVAVACMATTLAMEQLLVPRRSFKQWQAMSAAEKTWPASLLSRGVRLRYEAMMDVRKDAFASLFRSYDGVGKSNATLISDDLHVQRASTQRESIIENMRIERVHPVTVESYGDNAWTMTEVVVQLAWSLLGVDKTARDWKVAHPGAPGAVAQQHVELSVLRPLLSPNEVQRVVANLPETFDLARADVEMVPKRWIVVERGGVTIEGQEKLAAVMRPFVTHRILPFVRERFKCPDCLVCSSIVRRYSHTLGERHRDPPHTDGQAFATIVIALNSADADYSGGIYVITDPARPRFLAMHAGDALVHRWDLQHGVQVNSGKRISWILWVQDTSPCVPQEDFHKRQFFLRAAESGNVVAMHIIGTAAGDRSDMGRKWLQQAADAGFIKSMSQLGQVLQASDAHASQKWLTVAAQQNDANAQLNLGMALLRAGKLQDAEVWLQKAAVAGHATAQNEFGMALLMGAFRGAPEPQAAVRWLAAAARQGHAMAQTNLGVCHVEGRGIRQSLPAALYWWQEAALQGMSDAVANLERMRKDHPEWNSWPAYTGD